MISASIPLRPDGLALVLNERAKKDVLDGFVGDMIWSLLASLHTLSDSKFDVPTCSDMISMMKNNYTMEDLKREKRKQGRKVKRETAHFVVDMINRFLPEGAEHYEVV